MEFFHLFVDNQGRGIAVHNSAEALDKAPYERIEMRLGEKPVAQDIAIRALHRVGGELVFADRVEQVHVRQ